MTRPLSTTARLLLIGTALLALSACGARRDLRPAKGDTMPPAPYGDTAKPTTDKLLALPPTARPQRSDEALKDSHEREPDPFDLPPTG